MLPEQIETLNNIIDASKYAEENSKTILSKHYIYVDPSGSYALPRMEDVAAMIKGRITELMNNPEQPVERPKEPPIDPIEFINQPC